MIDQYGFDTSKDHPFKYMDVLEVITIENDISKNQVYAHVYGRSVGKKFRTQTKNGKLLVQRLS